MLVVCGTKSIGRAYLTTTVVFARRFWLNVIQREGLLLDTRFAPASRREPREGTCYYLLERGTFELDGGPRLEGPVGLAFSEQLLEGAAGVREVAFRTGRTPFTAVELHVGAHDVVTPASAPVAFDVGETGWRRVRALVEVATELPYSPRLEVEVERLATWLFERGLVSARLTRELHKPLPYERLLRAVRPLAERLALSATLDEISLTGAASSRQLDRWFRDFLRVFPLVGTSWRTTTLHLRVKLAVLFLSAADATVADVARAVGYGSTEAMARAFRDARIPSPSAIREALLAPPSTPRR